MSTRKKDQAAEAAETTETVQGTAATKEAAAAAQGAAQETEVQRAKGAEEAAAHGGEEELHFPSPCVYCGPSVRGVSRQFTTYVGGVPEALKAFVREHPAAKGLMVSVGRFPAVRANLNKAGSAEAILFKKIKSEL